MNNNAKLLTTGFVIVAFAFITFFVTKSILHSSTKGLVCAIVVLVGAVIAVIPLVNQWQKKDIQDQKRNLQTEKSSKWRADIRQAMEKIQMLPEGKDRKILGQCGEKLHKTLAGLEDADSLWTTSLLVDALPQFISTVDRYCLLQADHAATAKSKEFKTLSALLPEYHERVLIPKCNMGEEEVVPAIKTETLVEELQMEITMRKEAQKA